MSKLHCRNAGKADCFLLELEEGVKRYYILIDGGSKKEGNVLPAEYLRKRGIHKLDCIILTHLHQDHLGYLPEVADSLQVERAILPYPPIPLSKKEAKGIGDEERIEDIAAFNRLWKILTGSRCKVDTTLPLTCPVLRFGTYELRCLFPFPDTASYVYLMMCRFQHERPERIRSMYDSIRTRFNGDSSIWILKRGEQPVALMCGDGYHASLVAAVGGYGIHVPIVKLSHHGRNDKGNLYYQESLIRSFRSEKIIITSDRETAALRMEEWSHIDNEAELLITGLYEESAEILF